ncbi:sensor histidine kinase [Methylococcus mesophilus]|uniref:sensor histidine kinase n=1 Tax=Methylococcus mesophilus TaxID=2993564 RepID=UPI00224AD9B1|nr:histidine kinase [Methylococcus mesophilus]UZR28553.1 histidine kinase [Methylococcus mesophilus]
MNKTADIAATANESCSVMQATLRLNLLYWLCMFAADSLLGYFINIDPIESAPLKLVLFGFSALMTYAMARLLFRLRHRLSFLQKAFLCFLMAAVAAPVYTAIDFLNYTLCQYPKPVTLDPVYSGYTLIEGASMLFGWSCLFVAVLDNFEVLERERLLAVARKEALAAQMQALRYQINPHFLFNTLNSIAGLIEEGAATRAERMVLSLSTFMRTTLALDPMHDVSLADEIALQEEYLEIERERFADRMSFKISVPDDVKSALVPSLILQPLIENSIKHGVGATVGPVEVTLSAYREDNRLHVIVENDMPRDDASADSRPGMGVGLCNVDERLRVRFQDAAGFLAGRISTSRYRAAIILPWRSA